MWHLQIALHCIVLDNYLGVSISIRAHRERRDFYSVGMGWVCGIIGKCLECGVQYETGERGDTGLVRAEDRPGPGYLHLV